MMNRRTIRRAAIVMAVATAVQSSYGASYYFDANAAPGGNGSAASPWNTLSPFNSLTFGPGDNVYLNGTFNAPTGGMSMTSEDGGTAANPVTITSLNPSSRATILASDSYGFRATDVGGIKLSGINFIGSGPASKDATNLYTNQHDGVRFYTSEGVKKDFVHVSNVLVDGFGENGIKVGAHNGASGFNNVNISNVIARNNQRAGVNFEGDFNGANRSAHTNVYIGHVIAANNPGRADRPNEGNSGSGIVIGQVNGGIIEKSVAYGNGFECKSEQGGPVGIWAWDSNNVKIQFNESHSNRTGGHHDGGGFDLDGGVTNSVMQYNYSHDNDGAGFLLAQFSNAKPFNGNTVRYNVSQNDGRKNGYGGIHAFGTINQTLVHNNTIFMGPSMKGQPNTRPEAPSAIRFRDGGTKDIDFFNNLLIISDEGADSNWYLPNLLQLGSASSYQLLNNAYWKMDGSPLSVSQDPSAINLDPRVLAAGLAGTFDDAELLGNLLEYKLDDNSPLIDRGLDLFALFGIDMGGVDFFGTTRHGSQWDIGAAESLVGGAYVPEPAALTVLAAGVVGMLARRRRRL